MNEIKNNSKSTLYIIIVMLAGVILLLIGVLAFLMLSSDKESSDEKVVVMETAQVQTIAEEATQAQQFDISKYPLGAYQDVEHKNVDVMYEGGNKLQLKKLTPDSVSFEVLSISSSPGNKIASIEIEDAEIINNEASFTFDNDGWNNRGNGTIVFEEDGNIRLITEITRRDQDANWDIGTLNKELVFVE